MDLTTEELAGSAIAGILGTLAFGGFFVAIGNTGVIEMAIPAMYGVSGPAPLIGWAIHLFHGAVLGVLYAVIVNSTGYGHHLDELPKAAGLGLGYGVVTTVALAALLMPVWLSSVGFQGAPPFPNFSPMGLVGHLIYGGVLGVSYPVIRDRM